MPAFRSRSASFGFSLRAASYTTIASPVLPRCSSSIPLSFSAGSNLGSWCSCCILGESAGWLACAKPFVARTARIVAKIKPAHSAAVRFISAAFRRRQSGRPETRFPSAPHPLISPESLKKHVEWLLYRGSILFLIRVFGADLLGLNHHLLI